MDEMRRQTPVHINDAFARFRSFRLLNALRWMDMLVDKISLPCCLMFSTIA
jgi:hypothetical protein